MERERVLEPDQMPDLAPRGEFLHPLHGGREAVAEPHGEDEFGVSRREVVDLLGFLNGRRERLFDQRVQATRSGLLEHAQAGRRGRREDHGVDFEPAIHRGEEIVERAERLAAVRFGEFLRGLDVHIDRGGEGHLRGVQCARVGARDRARPDECDVDHGFTPRDKVARAARAHMRTPAAGA